MDLSRLNRAVIIVFEKGYRVSSDGEIVRNPKGKVLKINLSPSGYPYFSARPFSRKEHKHSLSIPIHKLQAYQKFKNKLFDKNIEVRHLDGDPKNNHFENIVIGNHSKNMMDRPIKKRIKSAKHASSFKKNSWSDEFIQKIKREHEGGASYLDLSRKYNISKGSLSYRLSKTAKRRAL